MHCSDRGQTSKHHGLCSTQGVEEPWAVERVVNFVGSHGCRQISLKSDTEPAIIAIRNREECKAEATLENAVKRDKQTNGLIENAVLFLRGIIRTTICHIQSCQAQHHLRRMHLRSTGSVILQRAW